MKKDKTIKFSGAHRNLSSGMRRDSNAGKPNYLNVDFDALERFAVHMTKAEALHGKYNWKKACTIEDLEHCLQSLMRHTISVLRDVQDEDHSAAAKFNIDRVDAIRNALREKSPTAKLGLDDVRDHFNELG